MEIDLDAAPAICYCNAMRTRWVRPTFLRTEALMNRIARTADILPILALVCVVVVVRTVTGAP
jgi:hypothetical protein